MDICAILTKGQTNTCPKSMQKVYSQEAVLINYSEIETKTITTECTASTSRYRVAFSLEEGKKGVLFTAPSRSRTIKGWTTPVIDDNGMSYFMHHVQIILTGVNEDQKCILDSITNGAFVVALKLTDYVQGVAGEMVEAIEIFGIGTGLVSTADWSYDITENNGVTVIQLSSRENVGETALPYMYESAVVGSEILDFDNLFENEA